MTARGTSTTGTARPAARGGAPVTARALAVTLIALLGSVAVAVAADTALNERTVATAQAASTFADGTLSQSNSSAGSAILTASGMRPGDSASGTVTIENTGSLTGSFALGKSNVLDTPGPHGGALSGNLDLVVEDVTAPAAPVTAYAGKLGAMQTVALGALEAGASRSYRFTVAFPDSGAPASSSSHDNAYKGSSLSVQYDWYASEQSSPEPVPAPPTGTQEPPAGEEPPTTDPEPDTTAPALRLSGPKTQRARRRPRVVLFAVCDEPCTLTTSATLRIRVARKSRSLRLKGQRRTVAAGVRHRLTIKLSRKSIAALKRALKPRGREVPVTVVVTAVDGSGNKTSAKRRIRLRR